MMSEKLKTIKELADELSVTKQNIQYHYQRLPKELQLKSSNGSNLINSKAEKIILGKVESGSKSNTKDQQIGSKENFEDEKLDNPFINRLIKEVEYLKIDKDKIISTKDQQISSKDQQIEKLTNELVRGYGSRMTPEYKEICDWICNYKTNLKYRIKLLNKRNIDFCNRGLNFTYKLKIRMNKL